MNTRNITYFFILLFLATDFSLQAMHKQKFDEINQEDDTSNNKKHSTGSVFNFGIPINDNDDLYTNDNGDLSAKTNINDKNTITKRIPFASFSDKSKKHFLEIFLLGKKLTLKLNLLNINDAEQVAELKNIHAQLISLYLIVNPNRNTSDAPTGNEILDFIKSVSF